MFKSLVSGRGVLCNSEGDTPSPQMLYGGFHSQRSSLTLLSLPLSGYFLEPALHWEASRRGFYKLEWVGGGVTWDAGCVLPSPFSFFCIGFPGYCI